MNKTDINAGRWVWEKKGLIYSPHRKWFWNQSHAQTPVVDDTDGQMWRIFYASRDSQNQSRISFIEVKAGQPEKVLYEHPEPILPLGNRGAFDDCGVMPSCIVNNQGRKYLYYIGWTVRNTIPYHNSIGLAVSQDGRHYEKMFEGPILTINKQEPYFTGTCWVMWDRARWRMWYLSCCRWEMIEERPEPFYHIKCAESRDGVEWNRESKVAIDFKDTEEGGISSASVVKEKGLYRMWYSYRKARGYRNDTRNSYHIGYAESKDGFSWIRKDGESGFDLSLGGWDSEMTAYPYVVKYHGVKYLFYNGNGFGKTGFGYAVSES